MNGTTMIHDVVAVDLVNEINDQYACLNIQVTGRDGTKIVITLFNAEKDSYIPLSFSQTGGEDDINI